MFSKERGSEDDEEGGEDFPLKGERLRSPVGLLSSLFELLLLLLLLFIFLLVVLLF